MRLNKDFLTDMLEVLDLVIQERGYDGFISYELPSGLILMMYNQYPHYYRIELKDKFKRNIQSLIFSEEDSDGETE